MPHKDPEARKKYHDEYRDKNREKAREYTRQWIRSDHGRNKILLNKYGITLEEYNLMLEEQEHKCAICGDHESNTRWGKTVKLAVDHDHETGKVRGLLCQRCNTTLGRYKDSKTVWANFQRYLESVE
jgi:hypothetical protein